MLIIKINLHIVQGGFLLSSPVLWHLQTARFQKSYKFTASHTVQQGSNKLGYDIRFDVPHTELEKPLGSVPVLP